MSKENALEFLKYLASNEEALAKFSKFDLDELQEAAKELMAAGELDLRTYQRGRDRSVEEKYDI